MILKKTKQIFVRIGFVILFGASNANSMTLDDATKIWQNILTRSVMSDGGVDYIGIKKNVKQLDSFIDFHATANPKKWNSNARKAAYINLYNAQMIKALLDYSDHKNIKVSEEEFTKLKINSLPGVSIWKDKKYGAVLAGTRVSLNNIEHQLIRGHKTKKDLKKWQVATLDARIHAAVNCAALSCPYLRQTAYTEANVDKELDAAMVDYVNGTQYFTKKGDKMEANSIAKWYADDFEKAGKELGGAGGYFASFVRGSTEKDNWKRNYFKKHEVGKFFSTKYDYEYNWLINDKRNKR